MLFLTTNTNFAPRNRKIRNMIFQPKLFTTLKNYNKELFLKDLMAGVIVGIVAIPLAIAFGIASGVTPEKGLFTTIIAGFLVSLFGGSRVQVSGPTGALVIVVYGIIQQFGTTGLAIATMMAGIILVAMGLLKLGSVIKFIPFPVIIGLNSGIAVNIFTSQVKDFLGLDIEKLPVDFIHKWMEYGKHFNSINFWAVGTGILTIIIIAIIPKIFKKLPSFLATIIIITIGSFILRQYFGITGIETIADRFTINASLPSVNPPKMDFATIQSLIPTAFTIAMLGAIISLLSATVADGITGFRHNSNTELIAQGIANIVAPIFGGIPSTGAIARTMTNINNGGRTPVAGIIHAIVVLLILLFLGGLTKHIPIACLAGVLVIVSYNMSDWRTFKSLLRNPKSDVAVLITTFVLTVVLDLTIAIEVGLLLAVVLFIRRISETSNITIFKDDINEAAYIEGSVETEKIHLPEDVEVYEIEGPFFFGLANKFEETMKQIGDKPKVRIIRMRKVPFMDSTGIHNLESLIKMSHKDKTEILLSGVNPNVHQLLIKNGIDKMIGDENICSNINIAVKRAEILVKNEPKKNAHKEH